MIALNSIEQSVPQVSGQGRSIATPKLTSHEFLQLLVAQMQSQDPMEGMDTASFLNQLASLTTVQQLGELNTALLASQGENGFREAVGLIGHRIEAVADGRAVKGKVEAVMLRDGEALLVVGEHEISLTQLVRVK